MLAIWGPLLAILVVLAMLSLRGGGEAADGGPVAGASNSPTTSRVDTHPPAATPHSGLSLVAESDLPREARRTLDLIRAGGPFPYRQDGQTFGNRERLLPRRSNGYYREYTVVTPGEDDRGPRRIVAGEDGGLYWTSDHYASFRQILEGR